MFGKLMCRPCLFIYFFLKIGLVLEAFSQKGFALKNVKHEVSLHPRCSPRSALAPLFGSHSCEGATNWLSRRVSFRSVFNTVSLLRESNLMYKRLT